MDLMTQDLLQRVMRAEARLDALEKALRDSKTKPKGKERVKAFDPKVVEMVKDLMACWPKERGDGGHIHNDIIDACQNITLILESNHVNLDDLRDSCMGWLAAKPAYANAIQFYFGKRDDARWKTELRALLFKKEEIDKLH